MFKKNYQFILIFMVLGLILISCGGRKESLENYPEVILTAVVNNDTDTIEKLCTGKALKSCLREAKHAQEYKINISDFQILEIKELDPANKEIKFKFISTMGKKDKEETIEKEEQTMFIQIKKIDNKWKIEKIDEVS